MRIISDKKDYYDSVMRYGYDPSITYIRKEKGSYVKKHTDIIKSLYMETGAISFGLQFPGYSSLLVIGFCGKVRPVVEMRETDISGYNTIRHYLYSPADVEKFIKKYNDANYGSMKFWTSIFEMFNNSKVDSLYKEFFVESPIFVIEVNASYRRQDRISYNPLLKKYNFGKVKDAYTAFQDLRMWFSNIAAPEKKIPTMSNDENALRLGHGGKYSFRQRPKG